MNELIWVAGHSGMVGSALCRFLESKGRKLVTVDRAALDLRRQEDVELWVNTNKPTAIIFAAAKVGGIIANSNYPADFIYDNLVIQTNVINAAHNAGVDKLLGSSCIYPKFALQPIKEDALLTGPLEQTNEWYAIAKIAGIMTCQAYRRQHGRHYISVMPCNLYGKNDNFHPQNSHVIPALMRKLHEGKLNQSSEVVVWGTGKPMREFLHVDDLARAVVYCLDNYDNYHHINCGYGSDISIVELVKKMSKVIGYQGKIVFDTSKPDGTPRKLLDSTKIRNLGWAPEISLDQGILDTYKWFLENIDTAKA